MAPPFLFFFSSGSQPYPITGSSTSGRSGFLVTLCFFPHRPPPFPFTASFFLSTSMPAARQRRRGRKRGNDD